MCIYFLSQVLCVVLPMVGSCVTTLGLVTLVVVYDTGKKDIDVDDEGILVASIIFPLPLFLRVGSCVSFFFARSSASYIT